VEEILAYLIDLFGPVVLDWTLREIEQRLREGHHPDIPHPSACECSRCLDPDFDADELGIDPEAEGWAQD
jgi:hypothetical protein